MERAARLLIETDEKNYVIAGQVGYADPNYFSYVFKRQFGVSRPNTEWSIQTVKNKSIRFWDSIKPREIQSTIMAAFSLISVFIMLVMGIIMYNRFLSIIRKKMSRIPRSSSSRPGKVSKTIWSVCVRFQTPCITTPLRKANFPGMCRIFR